MKKYTFLIIVFNVYFSSGQNPLVKQWDHCFGGVYSDYLSSLQQTNDNGFILGGVSVSGIDGDKTQANWDTTYPITWDYWIVKTDSNGIKQWDKDLGGTGNDVLYSLQQTSDQGYILGGYSSSNVGGDKTQATWGNNSDFWIVKIDSLGNKQWDKDFGGTGGDALYSLQQTTDRGYILGGTSSSGISGDKTSPVWGGVIDEDYWVVKIDSLGNKQWDKDFGGTGSDNLYSLLQTNDGGYMIGGYSKSGISGDKTEANWDTSGNTNDYWIIKIDSLGMKQWDKNFGGLAEDQLYTLKQTYDHGYILGGWSQSGIGGDKTQSVWGNCDYWIVKVDSLGNKEWDKDLGGSDFETVFGNIISQTADSGYLISGQSRSGISGDKTENNIGTWVVKMDSNGNKQWDKTLSTLGDQDGGFAIQITDGCFVIANDTRAGIGGDKTQANWDSTNSFADYWLIKFCDSTLATNIPQSENKSSNSEIHFSPNPTTSFLKIETSQSIEHIDLFNLLGEKVPAAIDCRLRTVDCSLLPPGIYILQASGEGKVWRGKVVKE